MKQDSRISRANKLEGLFLACVLSCTLANGIKQCEMLQLSSRSSVDQVCCCLIASVLLLSEFLCTVKISESWAKKQKQHH